MIRTIIYALAIGLALLIPEKGTDVADIIPAELLQVTREEEFVVVETETGDRGRGRTFHEAAADLERRAVGVIFLDAVDYLLVTEDATDLRGEAQVYLKGNVQVYQVPKGADLSVAAAYLNAKKSS